MEYEIVILKSGVVSSFSIDQEKLMREYVMSLIDQKIPFKFKIFTQSV